MSISQNYPLTSPSLSLDFANTKALDPRITFSRPTSAVYYDGQTVTKAEENLLTYSEDVSQAVWTTNVSSKGLVAGTNPLGVSQNISRVTASGAGRGIQQARANTGTFALSVWLRSVSGSGNASILLTGITDSGYFAITSDWVRYTLTGTGTLNDVRFLAELSGDVFEFWGAQLEQRDTVTAYTPTTTQPITNYIPTLLTAPANSARFDHNPVTGESLGLLVEEQRTNLLLRSEEFDNVYWGKTNVTVTSNTVIAPDGTLTGDKLIPSTDANQHSLVAPDIPAGTYAWSAYFKSAEYIHAAITCFDGASYKVATLYDLENGTIVNSAVGSTSTITPVGNGWFRCTVSATLATGSLYGGAQYRPNIGGVSAVEGTAGDGYSGIYICGASLEQGSFSTSYIKTEASQVTRSADFASMTGANFSDWYRQDEGSFYAEAMTASNASSDQIIFGIIGTSLTNGVYIVRQSQAASGTVYGICNDAGLQVALLNLGTPSASTEIKTIMAYKTNDFAGSLNSATVVTDTSGRVSQGVTVAYIGSSGIDQYINSTIKRISYYPLRLSNTNLQALTS